jgi:hypothetical protein
MGDNGGGDIAPEISEAQQAEVASDVAMESIRQGLLDATLEIRRVDVICDNDKHFEKH